MNSLRLTTIVNEHQEIEIESSTENQKPQCCKIWNFFAISVFGI
jgi:hypothetical protein